MQKKTITIFGGTGFVGRYVVQRLADTGATLRIATRNAASAYFLKPTGDVGQVVPVTCNIHDDASVAHAIQDADTVINLIGILYEQGKNSFNTIHEAVPARIARMSAAKNVDRFIHVSALGADPNGKSKYARSKAAGEKSTQKFFPDTTILRPSIIFGPEDNFFNLFARMARFSPALPLIGGGTTKFQPVYVGDVAKAVEVSLKQKTGQIYELGGPEIYNFRELLTHMLTQTGQQRRLINIPWSLAALQGALLGLLPQPLLTLDQVRSLKTDNIVSKRAKTLTALGISPVNLKSILPTYLDKFADKPSKLGTS